MSSPKLASGFRTSPVLPLRRTVPPWRRATRLALPVVIVVFAFAFPYLVDRPRFWLPNIGVESLWLATIALSMVFLNRYLGLLSLGQVSVAGLCATPPCWKVMCRYRWSSSRTATQAIASS